MEKRRIKPRQGTILISEPSLRDYFFRQSVVLLAEHNEEGTFGLIINKPIEIRFNDLIKDFPPYDLPVYLGGPVKTDSLFYLHTYPDIEESIAIMENLYWGGDLEIIRELMHAGLLEPKEIRFFLGYSGWSPNQLDREIREKSWVLSQSTAREIIHEHPENLWRNYLRSMGKDYAIWSNFPADPGMN